MKTEFSTVEVDGHVMTVTLNRPDSRNALHADANHELGRVFDEFESNPDLWIAAVNGQAMGGGFELALACDIIVAADSATFGLTEPRVGLAALGGGIQRLVQELGPKRAHALLLTARKITAQQTADMGLVAEVVPAAELMATARRWAGDILECSPASVMATKAVIQSYINEGLEASNKGMFAIPEVRSLLSGPDAREGPTAFAEKRKPNWANPS